MGLPPPEAVGDGWETASLDGVGLDPAPLERLMNELRARPGHLVHGILIVRHERLVFEEYFPGRTHPTFGGYSYGWWALGGEYGRGAYAAWGWGGQKLIVMPELDMVVVFTGGSYWQPPLLTPHQMMAGYVLPAVDA